MRPAGSVFDIPSIKRLQFARALIALVSFSPLKLCMTIPRVKSLHNTKPVEAAERTACHCDYNPRQHSNRGITNCTGNARAHNCCYAYTHDCTACHCISHQAATGQLIAALLCRKGRNWFHQTSCMQPVA